MKSSGGRHRTVITGARSLARESRWALRDASYLDSNHEVSAARLLTGSGRSGTTWLQEIACESGNLRPVFEPFHSGRERKFRDLPRWRYIPTDTHDEPLEDRVRRVLEGRTRSPWTGQLNHGWSLKRYCGRVVKDIRASFSVGWMLARFPEVRHAHVVRHPVAVVYSGRSLGWNAGYVERALSQPALIEYLGLDRGSLPPPDRDRWRGQVLAWALENRAVARATGRRERTHLISYERAVTDSMAVKSFLEALDIEGPVDTARLGAASRMARGAKQSDFARPSWVGAVPPADVSEILRLVDDLGFADVFRANGSVDTDALLVRWKELAA